MLLITFLFSTALELDYLIARRRRAEQIPPSNAVLVDAAGGVASLYQQAAELARHIVQQRARLPDPSPDLEEHVEGDAEEVVVVHSDSEPDDFANEQEQVCGSTCFIIYLLLCHLPYATHPIQRVARRHNKMRRPRDRKLRSMWQRNIPISLQRVRSDVVVEVELHQHKQSPMCVTSLCVVAIF